MNTSMVSSLLWSTSSAQFSRLSDAADPWLSLNQSGQRRTKLVSAPAPTASALLDAEKPFHTGKERIQAFSEPHLVHSV